jgi:hypothetical protein
MLPALSPNGCTMLRDARIVRAMPCVQDRVGGFEGGYQAGEDSGLKRR